MNFERNVDKEILPNLNTCLIEKSRKTDIAMSPFVRREPIQETHADHRQKRTQKIGFILY